MDIKDNVSKTKGQKGKSKNSGQGSKGSGNVVSNNNNNVKSNANGVHNARNSQASSISAATNASTTVSSDTMSRDEVVSNLMAMGFEEPDCISAVTACGCDVDRAISWLCERPPEPTQAAGSRAGSAGSTQKKSDSNSKMGVEAELQKMMEAAAKAKKDADHKEELRRINRAWNAKAEGEKKRAEQERRAREVEKQAKTLAMNKSSQSLSAARGAPMYSQSPYSQQSGARQMKGPVQGGMGMAPAPVMMQQAYFPPLGAEGYPSLAQAQLQPQSRGQVQGQQQQQQQQPRQKQGKQAYEPSVSNPELSADGLNRGAREFVPKFAGKQQLVGVSMPPQPPAAGFMPSSPSQQQTQQPFVPLASGETWELGLSDGGSPESNAATTVGMGSAKWSPTAPTGGVGAGDAGNGTGDVFDTTMFNEALSAPFLSNAAKGNQSSLLGMLNIESTESWVSEPSMDISNLISGVIDSPAAVLDSNGGQN